MSKILIFSGTGDGRKLAENLATAGHEIIVCVATEYGEQLMPKNPNIKVHCGRMDEAHMHAFFSSCNMDVVIDATHPYAKVVSENIKNVCERGNYVYYRLLRDSYINAADNENIVVVDDIAGAAKYLNKCDGNIFVSTGSKELPEFVENISDKERVYVRVLPSVSVLQEITEIGLKGSQIICMQGPFGEELNYAMFVQTNCRYLVTKESGSVGGFPEKINAAKRAGLKVVVIKRPPEAGLSAEQILNKFNVSPDENIWKDSNSESGTADVIGEGSNFVTTDVTGENVIIAGIGMGAPDNMTVEVYKAVQNADVLIGASRMLEAAKKVLLRNTEMFSMYKSDDIAEKICENKGKNIVVVLSGDVGFYSGAKKLIEQLRERKVDNVEILPGISTVVYFASKLGIAWEDMTFVSVHGRSQNVVDAVKYNEKVFVLVGGANGVSDLCSRLVEKSLGDVRVFVGSNLSYANEKILNKCAKDLTGYVEEGVSAVIILNEKAVKKNVTHGLSDDFFIRDKVPMTKEEVRTVSLSKMNLKEDSVVYDIGAGSGSVTVECALCASKGIVYAIERKEEAVNLIRRNCDKTGVANVEIIKAYAPDIPNEDELKLLPPTHCFIGGSGGNLSEILDWIYSKNPDVKIVINAIALETLTEIMTELKKRNIDNAEIVCMNVSKSKKIAQYNMMMANNPVYIVSF